MVAYIIVAVMAYLIGSINFSVMISKKMAGFDLREKGSGNAGSTNVLRTVGKKAAAITLICDILKGVIFRSSCYNKLANWLNLFCICISTNYINTNGFSRFTCSSYSLSSINIIYCTKLYCTRKLYYFKYYSCHFSSI